MRDEIFKALQDVVIRYDEEAVDGLCRQALENGIDPNEAILEGLSKGMQVVGDLYDTQEYGIPEVLLCADTLNRGVEILKPYIQKEASTEKLNCRVVIGTVEGDIHSIGKNIVKLMLGVGGFEVIDLGEDVPSSGFIEEIRNSKTDIVALSTMMTTTLASMKCIIDDVRKEFPHMKFLIGGASVTSDTAQKYGADGYGENATEAVQISHKIRNAIKSPGL